MEGLMGPAGSLAVKKIGPKRAPWMWRLRNALRWGFLKGWIATFLIAPLANWWGVTTALATLEIKVRRADGQWIDYGIVGYRVVTDAGVAYIVDDFDNAAGSADVSLFNFHGIGTGSTAEAAADTALVTESTTALNPNSVRATGTRSQPAANQFRSVGTLTADAQIVTREHGLFTDVDVAEGTLLDRTVFAAVTLESADSLQSTYTITFTAGS